MCKHAEGLSAGACVPCLQNGLDKAAGDNLELVRVLNESVKLQSHYAELLNQYDGGKRLTFKSGLEWWQRCIAVEEACKLGVGDEEPETDGEKFGPS